MVAVFEIERQQPGSVGHMFHGMGFRVPMIEISNKTDFGRLGGMANEIDGPEGLLITVTHIVILGTQPLKSQG